MMDGEDVYRARLAACLTAAEAASLPQVKERHLTAAQSWQSLLDTVMERKANVIALQQAASSKAAAKEGDMMSDTYEIPEAVIDALVEDGEIAEKAFRENAGVSVAALAEGSLIPAARLEDIERGATPTDDELEAISETLAVPKDLLVNE